MRIPVEMPKRETDHRPVRSEDVRRVDWRFLLPGRRGGRFEHLVLLGGARSLGETVVKLGLARRVSRDVPRDDPADALVLLEDARAELEEAARSLSAGGALYWEIRRRSSAPWRTTPAAIRRRLIAAGLSPAALYWPRPDFECPSMYVPVGPRGVLSWYVETRLYPANLRRRVARRLLAFSSRRGGAWSFALMPRYAATATAGPAIDGAFGLASAISSAALEAEERAPLLLLRGRDSSRRAVLFPFARRAGTPAAVVKFWRFPDRNRNTEGEQETLRRIRSCLDPAIARTVPEPLGTVFWGELAAGVESYAPGQPLSYSIDARGRSLRRKIRDVLPAFDWLRAFQRQAQATRKPWDRPDVQQWIEEPLASYRSAFGARPDEERLFAAIRQRARALFGQPLPIVWAHPDLTGANIHVRGDAIAVIDWSGATPRLPLFDLLYFGMLWAAGVERKRDLESRLCRFRRTFLQQAAPDALARTIRDAIVRYLTDLEIARAFFPLLASMAWIVRSVECSERSRAVERGDLGANPHPGESYVEYVQVLAEESETFFAESSGAWWSA